MWIKRLRKPTGEDKKENDTNVQRKRATTRKWHDILKTNTLFGHKNGLRKWLIRTIHEAEQRRLKAQQEAEEAAEAERQRILLAQEQERLERAVEASNLNKEVNLSIQS